jgi:hypothetical protein
MILFKIILNRITTISFLLFVMSLGLFIPFFASQAFADYRSDAALINSSANPQASLTETRAQEIIPNYSSNPPQANYYNNPSAMDDQSHLALQSRYSGQNSGSGTSDIGADAGMVATSAFNNRGDYDLSDLPRDHSPAITNIDVSDIIRLFTIPYSDCHPSTTNSELHTINTCDQYYQATQNSCQINRDINVFSSYTYSCTKDLIYSNKACNKILTIACDGDNGECDAGGVNLISKTISGNFGGPLASSIGWNYNYPLIAINMYWLGPDIGHKWVSVNSNVDFNIRDISDIKMFYLRSITNRDGNIAVKLNNIRVSNNQDLIPYLRNGSNKIEVFINNALDGISSNLSIEVHQRCCTNPREIWTEFCS